MGRGRRAPPSVGGLIFPVLRRGTTAFRNEARLYWDRRTATPRAVGPGSDSHGIRLGLFDLLASAASPGDIVTIHRGGAPRFSSFARAHRGYTQGATFWDDFPGSQAGAASVGSLPWTKTDLGTGATLSKVAGSATGQRGGSAAGVVRMTTAASINTGSVLHLGTNPNPLLFAPVAVEGWCVVKLALPASVVNGHHWAGLWTHANTYPDSGLANTISGIGWRAAPTGAGVNWFGVVRNGTSETTRDLGLAADTIPKELAWEYQPEQGGRVQFYAAGAAVGTPVTTNLPSPGDPLSLLLGCYTTNGVANTLDTDYIGIFLPTGDRW